MRPARTGAAVSHFAREVAVLIHANGGGDGIGNDRLDQILAALIAFDFKELSELRCAKCIIVHVLLLTTGARSFGRRIARGS
jgi:hypothetical protein